jgi:hypothetical protein
VAFCSWLMLAAVLPTWMIAICVAIWVPITPWMVCILWQYLGAVMSRHEIVVNDQAVVYTIRLAGLMVSRRMLPLHAIRTVGCERVGVLSLGGGVQFATAGRQYYSREFSHHIGHFFRSYSFGKYLDFGERLWLTGEINEHLKELDPEAEVSMLLDLYMP